MDKQKVLSNLRSCLVSAKGQIPLQQLSKDYYTIIGTSIPYKSLGFRSLEDLLRSEPSMFTLLQSNGQTCVDAKHTEKSRHVAEMVSRQKSSKKPRKQVRFSPPQNGGAGGARDLRRTQHNQNRQGQQKEWRPKGFDNRREVQKMISDRPAAVSHNQFVTGPNIKLTKSPVQRKHSANKRLVVDRPVENIPPKEAAATQPKSRMKIPVDKLQAAAHKELPNVSCQVLSNAKQRIMRRSSEIKDSVTVNENVNVTDKNEITNGFQRSGDPVHDLQQFANHFKLGPIDISLSQFVLNRKQFHTCQIKLDKRTFQTYPHEFTDARSAERYCANIALKELEPIYAKDTQKQRRSLHFSSEKDVLERIPPMIEKHYHGLWVWQLELDYTDRFNEKLPVDWLKIIDSNPTIQVEKASDNYIIRHCNPGDRNTKWLPFMNIHDVSVPANTAQFDDEGQLYAEVTCVLSANEIWCRQFNTKEAEVFVKMEQEMEEFYQAYYTTLNADRITEAGYYVAWYEDGFYRIRAVTIGEETVHCFFIDYGDTTDIHIDYIFTMKREFAVCQAQAFVCRLVGLEELYEASLTSEALGAISQKFVVIEMAPEVEDNIDDLIIPVYMYDYETGNSINKELISTLTFESASPSLQKDGVTEVYVSNIESNGDIYIQIHSRGYHSLMELIKNLEQQIINHPPKSILAPITKSNSANRIYFTKSKLDNHYYRVSIIDWSPKGDMAQIYFIDKGHTDVVTLNKDVLYPLEKLSDVLDQYPAQAVKTRLAIDCAVPADFFKQLVEKELPPAEAPVLLKVVRCEEGTALVELFKRNDDEGLFCINKSVEMKALRKLKEDGNNNNIKNTLNKRKILIEAIKNVPSAGFLQHPPLPSKGEDLQVHVPFAVNPWNFFVQPLESQSALNSMMRKLQDVYKDVQYSPLQLEDILAGKIYASKHDDGHWYRTSVIKVINSGSISVFYCDFGYYANLTVQQLLPLDSEFTQLPYQALKAKLADIKPKQSKWTMDDCDYFKKLVEKRFFYCHLRDIEKDELYDSDIVLKLVLVDTSSESDIYIGKELIRKGIAI